MYIFVAQNIFFAWNNQLKHTYTVTYWSETFIDVIKLEGVFGLYKNVLRIIAYL